MNQHMRNHLLAVLFLTLLGGGVCMLGLGQRCGSGHGIERVTQQLLCQ